MKAIEAESLYGIFYFSSAVNAAKFFKTRNTNVFYYLQHPDIDYHGWKFRYIDDDDVLPVFINPNDVGMDIDSWEEQQRKNRKNLMRAALDPEYAKQFIMN